MIKLYKDNCVNILRTIDSKTIDLIIVDPPYNVSSSTNIGRKETKDINMNFGEWDIFESEQDFIEFTENWFLESMRILKEEGWMYVFFGTNWLWVLQQLIRKYHGHNIRQRTLFVWAKSNPAPSYRKYNWISSLETVLVFSKGKCRIPNFLYQDQMKNYMETSCRSNYGTTGHPTEKPVQLIEKFVDSSSNEGDLVLDCFMGSGTTGVACKELGRRFIGVEIEPKWFNIAKKRIKETDTIVKRIGDGLLI